MAFVASYELTGSRYALVEKVRVELGGVLAASVKCLFTGGIKNLNHLSPRELAEVQARANELKVELTGPIPV